MEDQIVMGGPTSPFGPGSVDGMLRETFKLCWWFLPIGQRTPEAVEREMRRLFDRVIGDLHEDAKAFGLGSTSESPDAQSSGSEKGS